MQCSLISTTFFVSLLFISHSVFAIFPDQMANGFFIGPEFYYLSRTRDGGTNQNGMMYGGRIGFERIKRCHWYLGTDILYAKGKLEGSSSSGSHIKSEMTDTIYEGRLGYTFQHNYGLYAFIVPFIGGGYFREVNDFTAPTPLPITFTDTFKYATAGVLTGLQFANYWNLGINFKLKWMLDGKSRVSDDPDFDDETLIMDNQFQYRLEVPLSYQFCYYSTYLEAEIVPFYEHRHFGGRENFPFDFIDTKFHLWGARLELSYRF